MINLVFSQSFKRAFKTRIKRQPDLKSKIEAKLRLLADDPYNPILRTRKLKGKLSDAWAFSVEYDCRIIFNFESNPETQEEEINLIDIGTHDEVYWIWFFIMLARFRSWWSLFDDGKGRSCIIQNIMN